MRKLQNEELNRLTPEAFKEATKIPVIIVLDNIRSQNNIGSVFRTADAFRIDKIYLCGITATPPHREIQKTALGATESVDWEYLPETKTALEKLRSEGYILIVVEQAEKSKKLGEFKFRINEKLAFVFGNEVHGVQQEIVDMADAVLEIPQFGTKHSFNIVVSAGIVLWDYYLQKK